MNNDKCSKRKLDRMTIRGGDFGKAGKRGGSEFTLDRLKDLLEDDVKNLARMAVDPKLRKESSAEVTDSSFSKICDISDQDLSMIMNRERVFATDSNIPAEGECMTLFPWKTGSFRVYSGSLDLLQHVILIKS